MDEILKKFVWIERFLSDWHQAATTARITKSAFVSKFLFNAELYKDFTDARSQFI